MRKPVTITLAREDLEFILDECIFYFFYQCHEKLNESHLGDIEKNNLQKNKNRAKKLYEELNKKTYE